MFKSVKYLILLSFVGLGCAVGPESHTDTIESPWSSHPLDNVHANLTKNARNWVHEETGVWFNAFVWRGNEHTDMHTPFATDRNTDCLQDLFKDFAAYPEQNLDSPEVHFMRDSQHAIWNWRSSRDTCEISKDIMLRATLEAFRLLDEYENIHEEFESNHRCPVDNNLDESKKNMFNYLLGHALHTMQDSTNNNHARRYGEGRKKISESCTGTGDSDANGCRHLENDLELCTTDYQVELCHTAEDISKGFLYMIATKLLNKNHSRMNIVNEMENWFVNGEGVYSGYFNCATANDDDSYYVPGNSIPHYQFKSGEIRAQIIPVITLILS